MIDNVFKRDYIHPNCPELDRYTLEDNRKIFMEDHDLVSEGCKADYIYDIRSLFSLHEFDHARLYKCRFSQVVLVCSNYGTTRPPHILGMEMMDPIYHLDATSYYKKFLHPKFLRKFISGLKMLKACGELDRITNQFKQNGNV
jgi:hypothetical protein